MYNEVVDKCIIEGKKRKILILDEAELERLFEQAEGDFDFLLFLIRELLELQNK